MFNLERAKQELSERNLKEFIKNAWHELEPNKTFIDNWHIDAICNHLEAVNDHKIKRLIINIPFRCMKSLITSVSFPAWVWVNKPETQFLTTSYDEALALRDAYKHRALVESLWYKLQWADRFKLSEGQTQKRFFMNNKGGHRMARGITSGTTGHGGDIIIADDPHNAKKVYSDKERANDINSWINQFMTRLNDPDKSAIIIVMQRLHEQDLTGLYLQDKGWDYLCLPMCFEEDKVRSSIGFRDPRNKPNELLWSERFSENTIAEYKKPPYSSYFFAAQLQQRPAPIEGGMIKREWFKYYKELPAVKRWSWSWDTAIKTGETNDYSVGELWAECENGYYLVKLWRNRVEYPELRRQVKLLYDNRKASEVIIEDKASGQQVLQDFQRIGNLPVIAMCPGQDMPNSKQERVLLVSSLFEAGKIYLPENDYWVSDFVDEIATFPNAMYDDMTDSCTQYLARRLAKREPRIINL